MSKLEFPITADLSVEAYEKICRDIREQPKWRVDSDTDCNYYDGAQLSRAVMRKLEEAGIPAQDSNFIKPTINAVLGMEARSRTDYKITSDDEQQDQMAEGLSAKIKEAETESRADRAMSDAYSSMMRSGVGWIEVTRAFNPFEYPYKVREIHRGEIYWDWSAREPDLSDARYLRRDKWVDRQQAMLMFPDSVELLDNVWGGWNTTDVYDSNDTGMARAMEIEQHWDQSREEFLNQTSGMVKLCELWYRYMEPAFIMRLPTGKAIEFMEGNPYHEAAVAQGVVQIERALLPRLRVSIWLGPHKLMDVPTPLPHKDFPYIPFWCFRKDRSRTPYGLIRDMRGPQDQILDLDILLYEIMNSVKIEVDNDALDLTQNTLREVTDNMNSLRSVTVLSAQRRNVAGFKVTREHALATQVYQLIAERKERIESVSGVYRAMLGQSTESSSGVAISNLVEQGSTVLAEPNDNFRYARRLCGQQLLAFCLNDMVGKPSSVAVQRGSQKQMVYFNRAWMDDAGRKGIENDLQLAQVKVILEDIPASASYRQQQLTSLSQMVQAAPIPMQMVLYPAMIELSDVPNRHDLADQLRKVSGVPLNTPEAEQQQAQKQQQQEAIQQKMIELEIGLKEATIAKTQAEAKRLSMPEGADTQGLDEQIGQLTDKIQELKTQLADKTDQHDLKARELDLKEEQMGLESKLSAEKMTTDDLLKRHKMAMDERLSSANLKSKDTKYSNVSMVR